MTTDGPVPIRAAGAVLWRPDGARPLVAIVHRPRYGDWSLPKGKLHDGEPAPAAAVREVTEETGFSAVLGRRLGQVRYEVPAGAATRSGPKTVDYWAARATGGAFTPNREVDRLRWVAPGEATDLLSYSWDRRVLAGFAEVPVATTTLLLLRHAKAGRRDAWHADDDLRPLSAAGHRQAGALRSFLPLFGPRLVFSAPLVRCVQTVQDLADQLGTAVVREPLLAEDCYWADPQAGWECILRLADRGVPAVLCSQGGAIPDLVRRLATGSGVGLRDEVPSAKGSTWVLSLLGRSLVAADYYPAP